MRPWKPCILFQVDEDLLREEQPSLVVLPELEGLPQPDQAELQRVLQHTVLPHADGVPGGAVVMQVSVVAWP